MKKMTKDQFEIISNSLIEKVDFPKIAHWMKLVDWKYYNQPNTPTIEEVREELKRVLTLAFCTSHDREYLCNGFLIRIDNNSIKVSFVIENLYSGISNDGTIYTGINTKSPRDTY